VKTLTDDERASITDPRVREMIERADTVSPSQITALHGRLTMKDHAWRSRPWGCGPATVIIQPGRRPRRAHARGPEGHDRAHRRRRREDVLRRHRRRRSRPGPDAGPAYLFFFAPEVEALS
jgi:hypothetical protein